MAAVYVARIAVPTQVDNHGTSQSGLVMRTEWLGSGRGGTWGIVAGYAWLDFQGGIQAGMA